MERLTTNKPVEEMSMTELAHNSCYAKDRLARYRDFETDIDARDLARKLMLEFGEWLPDYEEMLNDDTFDNEIMENLMYEPTGPCGLIALFYRNLWAMADLHTRLKEYEDAEEQGLLLRLPCKVGDVVYFPNKTWKRVFEKSVISIGFDGKTTWTRCGDGIYYLFGEEVFKTKEEAEQALVRMEKENGD